MTPSSRDDEPLSVGPDGQKKKQPDKPRQSSSLPRGIPLTPEEHRKAMAKLAAGKLEAGKKRNAQKPVTGPSVRKPENDPARPASRPVPKVVQPPAARPISTPPPSIKPPSPFASEPIIKAPQQPFPPSRPVQQKTEQPPPSSPSSPTTSAGNPPPAIKPPATPQTGVLFTGTSQPEQPRKPAPPPTGALFPSTTKPEQPEADKSKPPALPPVILTSPPVSKPVAPPDFARMPPEADEPRPVDVTPEPVSEIPKPESEPVARTESEPEAETETKAGSKPEAETELPVQEPQLPVVIVPPVAELPPPLPEIEETPAAPVTPWVVEPLAIEPLDTLKPAQAPEPVETVKPVEAVETVKPAEEAEAAQPPASDEPESLPVLVTPPVAASLPSEVESPPPATESAESAEPVEAIEAEPAKLSLAPAQPSLADEPRTPALQETPETPESPELAPAASTPVDPSPATDTEQEPDSPPVVQEPRLAPAAAAFVPFEPASSVEPASPAIDAAEPHVEPEPQPEPEPEPLPVYADPVYADTELVGAGSTDRRGLVLLVAIIISLAAHVALAWELHDKPLGYIDTALIHKANDVYRVYRAPKDLILPLDDTGDSENPANPNHNEQPPEQQSPLPDLSVAMLSAQAQELPKPAEADFHLNPKSIEDHNPVNSLLEGALGTPDIQLPPSVSQDMLLDIPLSTTFVGQGGTGDRGKGPGGPTDVAISALPQGSGRDQAASLLSQGDPFGSGSGAGTGEGMSGIGNPMAPVMPAPKLTDRADITDSRPLPAELMPGPIDLTSLTDKAASELAIPEHLDNDFAYEVTKYIPNPGWGATEDDKRGYFRVDITAKRSLKKLQTMPKDLVILIDTSGSVPQDWIDSTLRGVRDSLASLNPGDRFNIVFFKDNPAILGKEGILPVNDENLAKAREFLTSAKSSGMTDVNQALSRLLVRDVAVDRSYELILISDGRPTRGVMNTRELINLITRDNDLAASIYCMGIGKIQNRTLLEFLAYRNKGFCVFAEDSFNAAVTIRDLVSRLRYPIMKDIRLSTLGLNVDEVFPADLPTIHQGESFSIYGRFDPPGKPFTMRLIGHNGKQVFDFTFNRDMVQAPLGEEQISKSWGFWKLHHIYNQIILQGETRELRQAIEYLRRKYKLDTVYD